MSNNGPYNNIPMWNLKRSHRRRIESEWKHPSYSEREREMGKLGAKSFNVLYDIVRRIKITT